MTPDNTPTTVLLDGKLHQAAHLRRLPQRYQGELRRTREKHKFALCLCCDPQTRLKLVIRERNQKLHLAAWPDEAYRHSISCPFYSEREYAPLANRPTPLLNGGSRIDLVKPLIYAPKSDSAQATDTAPHTEEKASPMWALLHHLWEASGLNRWRPGWTRHWEFTRHAIMNTAQTTRVGGQSLDRCLYIPPVFSQARKEQINEAWKRFVKPLREAPRGSSTVRSALILGLVRSTDKNEWGIRVNLCNHPVPLTLPMGLAQHLMSYCRRAWASLNRLQDEPKRNIVFLGRIEATYKGSLIVTDAVLMLTNGHLIPCNNEMEIKVADALMTEGREFVRPLSFDTTQGDLPSFVHRQHDDSGVLETDMYCVPSGLTPHLRDRWLLHRTDEALATGHSVWYWVRDEIAKMPELPEVSER